MPAHLPVTGMAVVAIAVCAWAALSASAAPPDPREAAVRRVAEKHGVSAATPGFAVAVVDGGKVVFRGGFGLADVDGKRPIGPDTTFELASLSKPFTATAVCLLHDRGKLSFDDDARKYLPELPERDGRRPVLVSHLLRHTSGLPDYIGFPEPEPAHAGYLTNEDYVKLIADKPRLVKPRFAAGERYEYSNTNYLLLAVIVERVSKKPFGRFMREEVFAPLGMEHTWVNDRPDAPPTGQGRATIHATGYDREKNGSGWTATWGAPPVEKGALMTAGDGAVWSSVEDVVRFDAGMKDGKLLKPATWKLALTPSKTRDGKTNDYGFGWALERDADGRVTSYGHEGSWAGFHTAYYRYTGVDRAVVVLGNREDLKVGKAWEEIDALFDRERR